MSTAATAALSARRDIQLISLISTGHAFSHFYLLILPPVFSLMAADWGVSYVALGTLVAALSFSTLLGQIPAGLVVDRFGAKRILILGMALYSGAFFVAGLLDSYEAFFVLMIVAGIGNAVFHPADYSILNNRVDSSRIGRAFSIHTAAGYIGWVFAPGLMVGLSALWSWQAAVSICGALGLVVALAMVIFGDLLDAGSESRHAPIAKKDGQKSGIMLLTSLPIILLVLFFTLTASSGINSFGVVALQKLYGASLEIANGGLTGYMITSALGILIGGWLADRTKNHEAVAGYALIAGGSVVVTMGFGLYDAWSSAVVLTLTGLITGLIGPSRDMLVRKVAPAKSIGTAFAIVTIGYPVGGIITAPVYGYILDLDLPSVMFWLSGGLTVLAAITVFATIPSRRNVVSDYA